MVAAPWQFVRLADPTSAVSRLKTLADRARPNASQSSKSCAARHFPPANLRPCPTMTRMARYLSALLLVSAFSLIALAQSQPQPEPAPMPSPIAAPVDKPYPGPVQLSVDITDLTDRVWKVHEEIPVVSGAKEWCCSTRSGCRENMRPAARSPRSLESSPRSTAKKCSGCATPSTCTPYTCR